MGLLDIDICGPSVPKMLGLEGQEVHQSAAGWSPVYVEDNLAVMSIGEWVDGWAAGGVAAGAAGCQVALKARATLFQQHGDAISTSL